ncbi:MAG: diguanylate cyclase [Pseudomonadota bacterium]
MGLKAAKSISIIGLWAALMVVVGLSSAQAQALRPASDKASADITTEARYLRDTSGSTTLRDIVRPVAQRSFKVLKQPVLETSGEAPTTHWFKFEAVAPPNRPYRAVLYFTDKNISEFNAFMQVVGANADVVGYGRGRAASDAVERGYGIGLPLEIAAGETRNIFVSVRGQNLSGQLELWEPRALRAHIEQKDKTALGTLIFLGVVTLLVASLAFVTRTPAWFALAGSAVIFAAAFTVRYGLFPLPDVQLGQDWLLLLKASFAAMVLLFAGGLSRLAQRFPILGWFKTALVAAIVMSAILGFFAPPQADIVVYLSMAFAALFCVALGATVFSLETQPQWGIRTVQLVLSAALIVLAFPLPLEVEGVDRLPLILAVAGIGLLGAIEILGIARQAKPEQAARKEAAEEFALSEQLSKAQERGASTAQDMPAFDMPTALASLSSEAPEDERRLREIQPSPQEASSASDQRAALPDLSTLPENAYDTMTGVFNKATLMAIGEKLLLQVRRYERPVSALMLSLPEYEDLLQTGGQTTADRAAKLVSVTFMRELRESDVLGRLDAHVFVALLPETDLAGAKVAISRACQNLSERTLPTRTGMLRLQPIVSTLAMVAQHESFDAFLAELTDTLKPSPSSTGSAGQEAAE